MNIFLSNICFYMEYENGSGWGIWTHQSEEYETSVLAIAPTRNNEIKMVGVTGFEPALSSPQTRSETITGYTPRKISQIKCLDALFLSPHNDRN